MKGQSLPKSGVFGAFKGMVLVCFSLFEAFDF